MPAAPSSHACRRARAVVAFSAEQVYALAEMLRRFKGGAAVVMGALSPATRNAQVAMFQRGEVDYLVATDAIGMGLNMDVTHVAFAGPGEVRRPPRPPPDDRRNGADRRPRRAPPARRQLRHARPRRRRRPGFQRRGNQGDRGASLPPARPSLLAQRRPRFHRRPDADRQPRGEKRRPAAALGAAGDRPRRAQADRRGPGNRGHAGARGAAAVGGVRPSRFPQGRADAPRADGPPPVQLYRRRRAHPARMVRRRGGPARQCRAATSRRWSIGFVAPLRSVSSGFLLAAS